MIKNSSVLFDMRKNKNCLLPYEVIGDVAESRKEFQSFYEQLKRQK